ncbi:MAG TPA: protein tyrosine phosphatase [Mycobacteriales bacterium]|nr:protein tyrosine phosphatase [Mycobacteriales bacterium]
MPAEGFDLLTVCTGNICRSPMAERMAAAELARGLPPEQGARFRVHSAGTHGLDGWEVNPPAGARLAALGIGYDDFRARRLAESMVAEADLVLAATREHRSAAITLVPRAAARTFTLREFDRLVRLVDVADLPTGDPVERARALVAAAARQRGMVWVPPEEDDIADPYGRADAHFDACAREIADALRAPLQVICDPGFRPERPAEETT